jgi:hypothetical protein
VGVARRLRHERGRRRPGDQGSLGGGTVNVVLDDHQDDTVDEPIDAFDQFAEFDDDQFDEFDDDDFDDFDDDGHADPTPIRRFEQSAVGTVFSAGLLGLRDVFEPPKKDEVQVVTDWSGDPPFTDPYVLRLDPEHPEDSIVMVRPWLRSARDEADAADAADAESDNTD